MIIAIPFVPQRGDFTKLAASLIKFGGLRNHILLVASQPEYAGNAQEFYDSVKDQFSSSHLEVLGDIPTNGFHIGNALFTASTKWSASYVSQPGEISEPPILYLDPAFIPNKAHWVDEIQSTYYRHKTLVLGTTTDLEDTTVKIGSITHTIEGGKFFTGPVVLDNKFANRSDLIKFLQPDAIWRNTLRWEMLKSHTHTDFDGAFILASDAATIGTPAPASEPVEEALPEPVEEEPESPLAALIAEDKVKTPTKAELRRPTARTK